MGSSAQTLGRRRATLQSTVDKSAQTLPKLELPERIRRDLKVGETIYHSRMACHVSAKFPDGKWVGQVRREEKGRLVKFPVKAFGTPREALDYVRSLRPGGKATAQRANEPTVADLYDFVTEHRQKRIKDITKANKESRWRLHIAPMWGDWPISRVTKRAAQEWLTEVEAEVTTGTYVSESGSPQAFGLAQLEKVRTDLHALFESAGSFEPEYQDRKNPFADLDFLARPPRIKATLESQHYGALVHACFQLVECELCVPWIVQMFLTSLLSGLREGEVMGLCRDQLDFKHGAMVVDRALRRKAHAIDPKTRLEGGPVLRQAMNLPKGGTPTNPKIRIVPMSDHLAEILQPVADASGFNGAAWDLLWPSEEGTLRELSRFRSVLRTLLQRLNEIATLAPLRHSGSSWPDVPKRQGWVRNPVIAEARRTPRLRLPDVFGGFEFRDTRSSFASYMNEVNLSQATREHILGHANGLTNFTYTEVTTRAFQDARDRLTNGWKPFSDGTPGGASG